MIGAMVVAMLPGPIAGVGITDKDRRPLRVALTYFWDAKQAVGESRKSLRIYESALEHLEEHERSLWQHRRINKIETEKRVRLFRYGEFSGNAVDAG